METCAEDNSGVPIADLLSLPVFWLPPGSTFLVIDPEQVCRAGKSKCSVCEIRSVVSYSLQFYGPVLWAPCLRHLRTFSIEHSWWVFYEVGHQVFPQPSPFALLCLGNGNVPQKTPKKTHLSLQKSACEKHTKICTLVHLPKKCNLLWPTGRKTLVRGKT